MFKLPADKKFSYWKKFRTEVKLLPIPEALTQINNFWASCPFLPYYLEYDNFKDWPDPWRLIQENYYCDLAKTLGIVYTIHLTGILKPTEIELRVYTDTEKKHNFHLAYLCQGKYVLNLKDDTVVNKEHIHQNLKLLYCYTAEELQLAKY